MQGDEVYLAAYSVRSNIHPFVKVSLHKSGNWHIRVEKKIVEKWHRPKDDSGIVNGILVLVDPLAAREPFKNKTVEDGPIKWIALAPFGKLVALVVHIAAKDANLGRFPVESRILAKLKKSNGEQAIFVAYDMPLTPELKNQIIEIRSKLKISVSEGKTMKANFADSTRMIMTFSPGAPGEMSAIYDLALGWENVVSE